MMLKTVKQPNYKYYEYKSLESYETLKRNKFDSPLFSYQLFF